MKIKEAIEELKTFNPEAEITTTFSETITFSWISDSTRDCEKTKKNTKVVFIEPAEEEEE